MDSRLNGSVTCWLDGLRENHPAAAQQLWSRYFAQLVPLARRHLHGLGRDADEEDIALSALKSAMIGVQNNRFPDLNDRTGLWPLLVTITARKSINEIKRQRAKKRDRAVEEATQDVQGIVGSEPSADFALRMTEALDALVTALGDDTLRVIAQRKLEGFDNEEIAEQLEVSTRTIVRKLARIRQEWQESQGMQ
jgi:RNA polymerase sigma factor (sigma-70 family)